MNFTIAEVQLYDRKAFWVLDDCYKKVKSFETRREAEQFVNGSYRSYFYAELLGNSDAETKEQD